MKLKTVRKAIWIFLAAYFLLMLMAGITKSAIFIWIMLALCVPAVVIVHKYWRCPKCGNMPRGGPYCSHCGEKLDL